jgi:hypothetical protein
MLQEPNINLLERLLYSQLDEDHAFYEVIVHLRSCIKVIDEELSKFHELLDINRSEHNEDMRYLTLETLQEYIDNVKKLAEKYDVSEQAETLLDMYRAIASRRERLLKQHALLFNVESDDVLLIKKLVVEEVEV